MSIRTLIRTVCMVAAVASQSGCTGCGSHYSVGERTGVITKFSKKGLIWNSWEGDMLMGGTVQTQQGAVANVWSFHASHSMASKVQTAMDTGKPVIVKYHQWLVSPSDQDSAYDIDDVVPVRAAPIALPITTATP